MKHNPSIDATNFIEELFLSLCNKLARHKDLDLIYIMLEYISYDELKKISKGLEGLMKLLSEYDAKRSGFDIGSLDDIAQKIVPRLLFKSYIDRDEDKELKDSISKEDFIIIKGLPGSGKSTMLGNALHLYKEDKFTHCVWLESFYNYYQRGNALYAELNSLDNFVIVCDDMHYIKELNDIRFTLENIQKLAKNRNKRFKFIGCTRSDAYLGPNIKPKVIELKRFTNEELVNSCQSYYNVKLSDGITSDFILKKSDGTPLYIISLFARFKDKIVKESDLARLPNNIIELWKDYIKYLKNNNSLNDNHILVLRSIALLCFISLTINDKDVYSKVFKGISLADMLAIDLYNLNLVTKYNDEHYFMHDAHAEVIESIYELNYYIISNFIKITNNIGKLLIITIWLYDKQKYEEVIKS